MDLPTTPDALWEWISIQLPVPVAVTVAFVGSAILWILFAFQVIEKTNTALLLMGEVGRKISAAANGLSVTSDDPQAFKKKSEELTNFLHQRWGVRYTENSGFTEGLRYIFRFKSAARAKADLVRLARDPRKFLNTWYGKALKSDKRIRPGEMLAIAELAFDFDSKLALEALAECLKLDGSNPLPARLKGYLELRDAEAWPAAIQTWTEVLNGAQRWQLDAILGIANYYIQKGELDEAKSYLDGALSITSAPGMGSHRLKVLNDLGHVILRSDRPEGALPYLNQALEIAKAQRNEAMVAVILCNKGALLNRIDPNEAVSHFAAATEILKRTGSNPQALGNALSGLSNAQVTSGDLNGALGSIESAIDVYRQAGITVGSGENFILKAMILEKMGRNDEAVVLRSEAKRLQVLA